MFSVSLIPLVYSPCLLSLQPKPSPSVVLLCDDQHSVGYSRRYTLHPPQAQSQAVRILNKPQARLHIHQNITLRSADLLKYVFLFPMQMTKLWFFVNKLICCYFSEVIQHLSH